MKTDDLQRIAVLGAGFSKPAGLPLADELFPLVMRRINSIIGTETKFHSSVDEYLDYRNATEDGDDDRSLDLEDFCEYLDNQHSFRLLGKDTWSDEANIDQMMLRWAIGSALHEHTPSKAALPEPYLEFARQLRPGDVIVTLNQDLIVERALEEAGVPYRRFPTRLKWIWGPGGEVGTDAELAEVALVKLHGSVDWVSRAPHDDIYGAGRSGDPGSPPDYDPIFGDSPISAARPLIEGLSFDDDPLRSVHVIEDLDSYYCSRRAYQRPPLILTPSSMKALYARELRPFWKGIGLFGWNWGGLTIIGVSLRGTDRHVRQMIF